jgi:hypothetical protein
LAHLGLTLAQTSVSMAAHSRKPEGNHCQKECQIVKLQHLPKLLLLLSVVCAACEDRANSTAGGGNASPTASATASPSAPLPDVKVLLNKLVTQDGAKDFTAEMRLQVEEADGKRETLEFQLQRKYSADKTATFLKVTAPRDESDKALLAVEKPQQPTEAFSYLAGLKRFARLNSGNTLNFRNSKVAVQELLGLELNQYDFKAGERVTQEGMELIQVEGKAKLDLNLAYPRLLVFFRADNQQPARFELFNDGNERVKTIRIEEVKAIQNHQTITKVSVEEHQTKRKLKQEIRAIKYDQKLSDQIFTESYLKSFTTGASQKLIQ